MTGFLDHIEEQARKVREHEAQRQRAQDLTQEKQIRSIVKETTAKIMAMIGGGTPRYVTSFHEFEEYSNPNQHAGCVRCPYAKDHPVHTTNKEA